MRTQATDYEPAGGASRFRRRETKPMLDASLAALSEDADVALEDCRFAEGLSMLRRVWRATLDPWHLARIGTVLYRRKRLRRARVALECAIGMEPFHLLAASVLMQVAEAQGDYPASRRVWERTLRDHAAELPPEPW